MRISGLLVILLCGLVPVFGASDAARQASSPQTTANSFNPDWVDSSAIAHYDFDHHRSDTARDGELICYTIQNFVVKRTSPHSDVTEPHGYSYCLPSWKYGVKIVQEPGKAPSR
jgi:hypothetical protein